MANAVITVTVVDSWHDSKREHVISTIAITNLNYVTGGLPITWVGQEFVKSAIFPIHAYISGINGFMYVLDFVLSTFRIYQTGSALSGALTELTGGSALTAGISTDTIRSYTIHKLL